MARRPRNKGVKNKPETMKELVQAVSGILKNEGHFGLHVNNVARYSGRSRNLINRYFGSIEGLKKAYIMANDFWEPLLDRFSIEDADDIEEVQQTFTQLMQETFRYFLPNREMQKLILWQISEEHELLTQVSVAREIKAEQLFSQSDPSFRNTGINFRAVTGLLLGGIYYMVLHARTNKSMVCGIDLNLKKDQEELLKTIAQIIGWACAAANDNEIKSQSIPMMTYQFELLDRIAAELSERKTPAQSASPLLVTECNKLKRAIPSHVLSLKNETQIRSYLKMVVTKLGEVIAELYEPEQALNPDADLLVELLKVVLNYHLDVLPNETILPKLYCVHEGVAFHQRWLVVKSRLEEVGISDDLRSLVYFPFSRLSLAHAEVSLYDLKYLKLFCLVLEQEVLEGVLDDAGLMEVLIGLGYNQSRFKAFITTRWKELLRGKDPMSKQGILEEQYVWVGQAISRTSLIFDQDKPALVDDLLSWINIELKKGLALGLNSDEEIYDNALNTVFSTPELAAWQKLQYDAGIYMENNVDEFTGKVSYNFKTRRGRASGKSVKSKLYGKDLETYQALRPFVNKMKEDIDRFLM